MECNICCEPYNKSNHKLIRCDYDKCGFEFCFQCVKKYLLETPEKPHCMNCKREWTREILVEKLPASFINKELKEHRENILFEIEKGLLPSTQKQAEKTKKIREYDEEQKEFRKKLKDVRNIFNSYDYATNDIEELRILKDLKIEILSYQEEIKFIEKLKDIVQHRNEKNPRVAFIKPCPKNDCRGFLSTGWKCGLCSIKVCSNCHELENEGHECEPDAVETVKLLKKESKPCPKCGSLIQKTEGCSQMFHTPLSGGCGAVFDWDTLKLHTHGAIHNPHYFEYLRKQNGGNIPRQAGDEICGGLPRYQEFHRNLRVLSDGKQLTQLQFAGFLELYEAYEHNDDVELEKYRVNVINDNEFLRVQYLLNDITEEQFKKRLQQKEKLNDKKRNIYLILHMYQTTILEILRRLMETKHRKELFSLMEEVDTIKNYTNEHLKKVSDLYKSSKIVNVKDNFKIDG